jgi:Mce-associated membrane protein
MATTKTTSTRSRSTTAKRAPRRRTASTASKTRAQSIASDAKTAVRAVRTRATRAAKKVPTDRTSLSIAAGVLAGIVAAGVAIFMNRDRLRSAASTGSERLKKAADDLSTMAHERIDQARDNITRFRTRSNGSAATSASEQASSDSTAMHG